MNQTKEEFIESIRAIREMLKTDECAEYFDYLEEVAPGRKPD